MTNAMQGLQETLPELQQLVESAEHHRDEHSVEVLKKYVGLHLGDLLPLTSTMSQGILDQIITYLGAADEDTKRLVRQRYTALWEIFIRENTSGIVGLLLAKEIVLSAMLLELSTAKLVRFFPYAGGKEGRLMESLQGRYLKSLKLFQKLNGKLPSMAVNLTQINLETPTKGQQTYGEYV
jgi:hypothetical protein